MGRIFYSKPVIPKVFKKNLTIVKLDCFYECYHQCDQIGQVFQVFDNKLSAQKKPKYLAHFLDSF